MNNKLFFGLASILLVSSFFAMTAVKSTQSEPQLHRNSLGEVHELVVYKDPTCGCCGNWVSYMKSKGYKIEVDETSDVETIKERYMIPEALYSCHTTLVNNGDYYIEGHIPEESIAKLLNKTPTIRGIGMPGMPSGSPGMPGAKEGPFNIMQVDHAENVSLFESV